MYESWATAQRIERRRNESKRISKRVLLMSTEFTIDSETAIRCLRTMQNLAFEFVYIELVPLRTTNNVQIRDAKIPGFSICLGPGIF